MPKHNPLQKIKDTTNMRNNAIDRFFQNRKPAEVKDVEVYNPRTKKSKTNQKHLKEKPYTRDGKKNIENKMNNESGKK